jgi:hypothetical protein
VVNVSPIRLAGPDRIGSSEMHKVGLNNALRLRKFLSGTRQ